jgi:hypothetical protein
MLPSGSLELLPSSETLSIGKVIAWSGPATAIGGLFFSAQPSHGISFWHESSTNTVISKIKEEIFCTDLIIKKIKWWLPTIIP